MKIIKTGDAQEKPSVVLLIYGEGGTGKTSFSATAPKPILADCENGTKYLGLRGISMDVARIDTWSDMKEFLELMKTDQYETAIIDPIDELMDKLKRYMIATGDGKLVQKDGSPTMAGWGWLKKTMRDYIKVIRDTGKHVIIIAHVQEIKDEDRLVKRPKVETKLADEIVNMVDIVGYMTVVQKDGESKRVIIVDPGSDKYTAKDRTGQLGKYIEPDFQKIIRACQGTESYSWSKPLTEKKAKEKTELTPPPKKEEKPVEDGKESVQSKMKKATEKTPDKKRPWAKKTAAEKVPTIEEDVTFED